jgi:NADPH-dependent 2,4-dienoyl-CoA reductase/sulfur reductase-like enzyme
MSGELSALGPIATGSSHGRSVRVRCASRLRPTLRRSRISRGATRRHHKTISATLRSTAEITGKQNTNLPHFNMWRVRGLLQDPGHPVETPTEARTYGVRGNVRVVVTVRFARGRVGHRRESDRSVAMTNHAVVIVGAGPTGLMLAGELALAATDVAIVERRASQDLIGSRAGGLHARGARSAWNR